MRNSPALFIVLTAISTLTTAQIPLPLAGANAASSADWKTATPILEAALECRQSLPHEDAIKAVFRLTNSNLNGTHTLPAPLTVFGLKTLVVSIFEGAANEGSSYTTHLDSVALADVARAARLVKDANGPRYTRQLKNGMLEASEPQPGHVQLSCIHGGDESQ